MRVELAAARSRRCEVHGNDQDRDHNPDHDETHRPQLLVGSLPNQSSRNERLLSETMPGDAARFWRESLGSWAIPEPILAAAPESPWVLPPAVFARAAQRAVADAYGGPSRRRASEALPEGGSVLDVGVGGGAASVPLAPPAQLLVAVDESADMLDAFARAADHRGVNHTEVLGTWPDVAHRVERADVAVCHHVVYNVAELVPFVEALISHARRRVVLELTARHPLTTSNWLCVSCTVWSGPPRRWPPTPRGRLGRIRPRASGPRAR